MHFCSLSLRVRHDSSEGDQKTKTIITSVGEIPYKYLSIERGKNEHLTKDQYASCGKRPATLSTVYAHLIFSDPNKTIYIVSSILPVWPIIFLLVYSVFSAIAMGETSAARMG